MAEDPRYPQLKRLDAKSALQRDSDSEEFSESVSG